MEGVSPGYTEIITPNNFIDFYYAYYGPSKDSIFVGDEFDYIHELYLASVANTQKSY